MPREITEQDFDKVRWDCDICPLYQRCLKAGYIGFMLTEDCYDDVMAFWKRTGIIPLYGFSEALKAYDLSELWS